MVALEANSLVYEIGNSQSGKHSESISIGTIVCDSLVASAYLLEVPTGVDYAATKKGNFVNKKGRGKKLLFKNFKDVSGPLDHLFSRPRKKKILKTKKRSNTDPGIIEGPILNLSSQSITISSSD